MVRWLSTPSCSKLFVSWPKRGLILTSEAAIGSTAPVVWSTRILKSPSCANVPPPPPKLASGASRGRLKMLSKSAPKVATTRSPIGKALWMPRFTPHAPGPVNIFLLATAGLPSRSDPTEGRPNELAFQIMALLPFFPVLMWLLRIKGLKEGSALKSPTASIDDTAMFPGSTGSQSSQTQNGVKPVPDFANMLKVVCQPPIRVSAHLENE